MAITIDTNTLPITPKEARDYLQRNTDNFGVFFDIDRCYELSGILQLSMLDCIRKSRRLTNKPNLDINDKNSLIETFVSMGVSKSTFVATNKKDLTLDAKVRKDIIESSATSDDAKELAKYLNTYTSDKRNKGNIENFANKGLLSEALSKRNHRMAIGRPTWSILNTSRLAASDPGVQGIPRSMGDIICEPKGYTLIRCDSGQIEPRINASAYLKDTLLMKLFMFYNDAYFGTLHFCKMSDKELEACREDFEANFKPIEITDDIKSMRQEIKRLTNGASYGSQNLGNINPQLAESYNRRIVNHPSRLALEAAVRDAVKRGEETFYGYFGTPVTPDETERYKKGDSGWYEHVIRCGINNPIQTTASELMMFSINEARNIIREAKDTHICFYKHDEACFYVSDEDMANGVGDRLSDITAYNVKGWVPIEADAIVGVKHGDYPSYIL